MMIGLKGQTWTQSQALNACVGPKPTLTGASGAFIPNVTCQVTKKLESCQCCGADRAALLCPLVASALLQAVLLQHHRFGQVWGILQFSIQCCCSCAGGGTVPQDLGWERCSGSHHGKQGVWELSAEAKEKRETQQESVFTWYSHCSSWFLCFFWHTHKPFGQLGAQGLSVPLKRGFPLRKAQAFLHSSKGPLICNFPSFPWQLLPFQMNAAGKPTSLPVFGGTCAYSKAQHCFVGWDTAAWSSGALWWLLGEAGNPPGWTRGAPELKPCSASLPQHPFLLCQMELWQSCVRAQPEQKCPLCAAESCNGWENLVMLKCLLLCLLTFCGTW